MSSSEDNNRNDQITDNSQSSSEEDSSDDEEETKTNQNEITLSTADIQNAITSLVTKAKGGTLPKINNNNQKKNQSNELTEIIPGYIAPMALDSSSLDIYKQRKGSQRKEISTSMSSINTKPSDFVSKNFKLAKADPSVTQRNKSNAGSSWFGFEATPNSSSLQADISIIRNRNYINPKKFYKSSDFGKKGEKRMVQLGTVIEGSMESVHTNRLTKKQRKDNVLEEVMGETFDTKHDYVKKKYTNMQREKTLAQSKARGRGRKFKRGKK